MFTKIDMKKFGLYKDFTWHPTKMQVFDQVNIIYGRNYSGKTTLSRVFDSVSQGVLHKNYLDGQFSLYTDDNSVLEVKETNMSDCPYLVRVYNSDFVGRNLGWLKDEEAGEIRSFTLLGEGNKKAQEAIDDIDAKLGSVEKKTGLLYTYDWKSTEYNCKKQAHDATKSAVDNQLRTKANGDIKTKNYFVKLGETYNVNNIQKDIDEIIIVGTETVDEHGFPYEKPQVKYTLDGSVILTEEKKKELELTVDEKEKSSIERLPEGETHLTGFMTTVKGLVTKKITLTKTLQELVENKLLQKWVDDGRELNKERKTCAFCGGLLTKERWDELDAHFSKESEELQKALQEQRSKMEAARQALDTFLEDRNFKKDNIYATLQGEYSKVKEEWDAYVEWYKKEVDGLIALLDERLANIFKPLEVAEFQETEDAVEESDTETTRMSLTPILKKINELIEKNKAYGVQQDEAKKKARKKLRLNYVHGFCVDINYAEVMERWVNEEDEVKTMEEAVKQLGTQISNLQKERKQKELEKKDEGKAAGKVSELLVKHFGAGSLSLEPEQVDEVDEDTGEVIPHTKFVVKRGMDYAKNLSEGERSLIGFCYFIAQMEDELNGPEAGRLVIFIDDPISSLDSSHVFFMYSLIDSVIAKPKKYGQLFISTHNLEFLKFLKRLKLPGNVNDKNVQHFVVEKLRKGDDDYKCEIKMMPDYLKEYVTEYNFLFQQVYDIARPIGGEKTEKYNKVYSQYYNVANNMRKFLECYLFYRFPDSDDPTRDHLDMLFEGHELSEVHRVINEYSHLAWAERGLKVIDVPEIEKTAKMIMKALQTKDPSHYEVLLKSVGIKERVDFS